MKKPAADLWIALSVVIILTIFLSQIRDIPESAAAYPQAIICLGYLVTALFLVKTLRGKSPRPPGKGGAPGILISYALLLLAYLLLIGRLGYVVCTLAFILISLLLLKVRSAKLLILLPVILTGGIYGLFTWVLSVALPSGCFI